MANTTEIYGTSIFFSTQYHPWIKHLSDRNKWNDHQLKKLWNDKQSLLFSTLGSMENSMENIHNDVRVERVKKIYNQAQENKIPSATLISLWLLGLVSIQILIMIFQYLIDLFTVNEWVTRSIEKIQ